MNSAKAALTAGMAMAKDIPMPDTIRTGFLAAAEKGRELAQGAPAVANQTFVYASANPATAACLVVGALGAGLVAAPMAAAGPVLAAGGLGATGPVAGTLAAGIQASIGNVVAGSIFATLQSAAMGGYGVAAVSGVVQGAGVSMMAGSAAKFISTANSDETSE